MNVGRIGRRLLTMTVLAAAPLSAQTAQTCPATGNGPMPLKYAGPPTVAAITPCDLMTRLYIFADDSMMGRQVGTIYNDRGTNYIERQVRLLGLQPAGDDGGYFQKIPVFAKSLDPASTVTVAGKTFHAETDFHASLGDDELGFKNDPTIYGGIAGDTAITLTPEQVKGKVLVLVAPEQARRFFRMTPGLRNYLEVIRAAKLSVSIAAGALPEQRGSRPSYDDPNDPAPKAGGNARAGGSLVVTPALGRAILGADPATMKPGQAGQPLSANLKMLKTSLPGRNVVAILPGSDPSVNHEYILIGAHNDHVGFRQGGVEHDSLKAYNALFKKQGADDRSRTEPTPEQWSGLNRIIDWVRTVQPARLDSIYNGADDDGSGSVSVLEVAQAMAHAPKAPRRSMLFIWHAGEEAGLWGSRFFSDHPTVPRDSIVGAINIDMIGRGAASDVTGTTKEGEMIHGGPGYLQVVGASRVSTELGRIVEEVNKKGNHGLHFDYALDANGHPQNIYCRSDHYEYARYSIPVVFFTTGGHADYHQLTDEPQYIQYRHMAHVDNYILDLAGTMANLDHVMKVDQPRPDPFGSCKQ